MKKKWQRTTALLMTLAMTGALVAGCGKSGSTEESSSAAGSETQAGASSTEGKEVSYPLANGGNLTYWMSLNPNVSANYTNMGDTEIGKAWQKNTGVTVEFQHPAAGQANEQFNLIVADGNLPDIMEWQWLKVYPGGPQKAIRDGVIIPLNDIIDKYCPNLKKCNYSALKSQQQSKTQQ